MKTHIGIVLVMGCTLMISGCLLGSFDSGSHRSRGSLSGAVEKSKSSDPEERRIEGRVHEEEPDWETPPPPPQWDPPHQTFRPPTPAEPDSVVSITQWLESVKAKNRTTSTVNPYATVDTVQTDNTPFNEYVELSYRHYFGSMYGKHATGPTRGGMIGIGYSARETSRTAFMFNLGYEHCDQEDGNNEESPFRGGLDSWNAQLTIRQSLTPWYTALGLELPIGIGLRSLAWRYRNPLFVTDYDEYGNPLEYETVSSDWVGGLDLNTGLSLNLVNTRRLLVGVEAIAGNVIWSVTTHEDFTNDYFGMTQYVKTGFFFTFRFW